MLQVRDREIIPRLGRPHGKDCPKVGRDALMRWNAISTSQNIYLRPSKYDRLNQASIASNRHTL
jgi:hypothetical protein